MRIHDLYIRFKTIYNNMYILSHYIHVQNMSAHNVNVRSFIYDPPPPPLVAKERRSAPGKKL